MSAKEIQSVKTKIKQLRPLLDLADHALKPPSKSSTIEDLQQAEKWLDDLILDFIPEFDAVYLQPHTGEKFWATVKVIGLASNNGLMSDLVPCIQMRRILNKFKRRVIKQIPILFGGVPHVTPKTKKEKSRVNNTEGHNQNVDGEGLASSGDESI
jgi:hypothetical protein